jgi:hypothetical protein
LDNFPHVTKALVDRLDSLFPNQCPRLDDTDRRVWYAAGQASVVTFLKQVLKDQQEQKS